MIAEIFKAMVEEVTLHPMNMLAEVAQFVVLAVIAWVVVIGVGGRRGFVLNMLAERSQASADRLREAADAEGALEAANLAAEQRVTAATAEAARLLKAAKHDTTATEKEAFAAADAEAARIVDRAHTALSNERAQMQADLRDELIGLVSEATRSIMNEALTVAEQRERIEKAIVSSVSAVNGGPATQGASVQPAVKPRRAQVASAKAD